MKVITIPVGKFQANCYLLIQEDTQETVVIDPGSDSLLIQQKISENACKPAFILLTHGHFDHIMSVNDIASQYNIPVYIHKEDAGKLRDEKQNYARQFLRAVCQVHWDRLLEDGERLPFGKEEILVIHTPGHSRGSVCYRAGNLLFSGDTLFENSIGRTDLGDGDSEELMNSLKKLCAVQEDLIVYPGHGNSTTLKNEKNFNPFLRSFV